MRKLVVAVILTASVTTPLGVALGRGRLVVAPSVAAQEQAASAAVLQTRRLDLTDEQGVVRAQLQVQADGAVVLTGLNAEGQPIANVGLWRPSSLE